MVALIFVMFAVKVLGETLSGFENFWVVNPFQIFMFAKFYDFQIARLRTITCYAMTTTM